MKQLFWVLLLAFPLAAQGVPDCQLRGSFTDVGFSVDVPNIPLPGCVGWRLTWLVSGFTGITIGLEGAQTSSFAPFAAALVQEGTNPTVWTGSTASNTIVVRGSLPHVKVHLSSVTGAGTVTFLLLGYKGTSAQLDIGGGSGTPSGISPAHGAVIAEGSNPVVATAPGLAGQCFVGTGATTDPVFGPCPFAGTLTYYLTNTASSVATYLQQTSAPFSPKTTLTFAGQPIGSDVLQNWATNVGFPSLTFIPAGVYTWHIHALKSAGGNATIHAEIWEVSSTGVDIAKIGTTEDSALLTGVETEYSLQFVDGNVYTLASANSRIVTRAVAVVTGFATAVQFFVGGTADSHISLPSNTVDATNFVPYTGAVSDVVLGPHGITAGSGAAGAVDFSGAASTVPARTGTGAPTGSNCSKAGDTFFQTDATAGQNLWLATTFGSPCTWTQVSGTVTPGPIAFLFSQTSNLYTTTPVFCRFVSTGLGCAGTEAVAQQGVPGALTISKLAVTIDTAMGGGKQVKFTLRKNGVDTALTCTIADPALTCSDSIHSAAVVLGDLVDTSAAMVASTASFGVPSMYYQGK